MLDDLPTIRTEPMHRRYTRPVGGRYANAVRSRKRSSRKAAWFLFLWASSAVLGSALGYAILFYRFHQDPLNLKAYLPAVTVEWPGDAASR